MDRKEQWIKSAPTDVLERILNNLGGPEVEEPSPEFPLRGIVQIDTVGQISVKALRAELARR